MSSLMSPLGRLPTSTPLVGRVAELDFLEQRYDAAASGAGGCLVFISGEPGVGKTRLARELGRYARGQGGHFLEGHYLRDGTPPYGPWVEALRSGLGGLTREELARAAGAFGAELAQIFPESIGQVDDWPSLPALSAEDRRHRLFEGMATLTRNLAERAPLVLLLDDLQWAPELALLAHLARRLTECRALIVGVYREQEFKEQPALVRTWAELNRTRLSSQVSLSPLDPEETAALVAHYFGEGPATVLGESVHQRTGGNAFFVEEVLRSLAETRAVRPDGGGWQVADTTRVSIPETMKLAVEERLARLGNAVRDVLAQAAVLGQEFGFRELQTMIQLPEEDLVSAIERLLAARLLVDRSVSGEESYAFIDDQVQEVLYETIPVPRRRRYHHQAGQALEGLHAGRPEPYLDELARHFSEGNDPVKAADYAYRAGVYNERLFNWSRSLRMYELASDLWEKQGGALDQQAAVFEKLGNICYKSSLDAPRGMAFYHRAVGLYERLGNRRKLATLHAQIGREYYSSANLRLYDLDKALQHLHRAREILEEEAETVPLGWAYVVLAYAYAVKLQWPDSLLWATRAEGIGERMQQAVLTANAREILAAALFSMGEIARGRAIREAGWDWCARNNFAFQADYYRLHGVISAVALKTPEEGLAWAAREPDFRTVSSVLFTPTHLAVVHALAGDLSRATKLMEGLQATWLALEQPVSGYYPSEFGFVLMRRGDWSAAGELLAEGLSWANESHCRLYAAPAAERLGELALFQREYARAEEHLRWALALYQEGADIVAQLGLLPTLAEVCVRTGRLDQARAHLDDAAAILARPENWGGLPGGVHLAEGMLRAAEGRWPDAEAAFAEAVAVDLQSALPWEAAKAYYEWATALLHAGEAGPLPPGQWRTNVDDLLDRAWSLWDSLDGSEPWQVRVWHAKAMLLLGQAEPDSQRRAGELIDRALATARELGIPCLIAESTALREQTHSSPRRAKSDGSKTYPDGLTRREVEVLRLIAAGRTTREIADELVIGVTTVERHISNLYGKIGARGRADAATYALTQRLV